LGEKSKIAARKGYGDYMRKYVETILRGLAI